MARSRLALVLPTALLLAALGCSSVVTVGGAGGSGTGGSGTGGSGTGGSGTGGSGTGGSGAGGSAFVSGYVRLTHLDEPTSGAFEQLYLTAAFYPSAWDPDVPSYGLVDSVATPDGVTCDLYYQSGGIPPDPPPPQPPPERDAGHVTAGAGGELLGIDFDGTHYGIDARTPNDPQHPMPSWLIPGPIDVDFGAAGSAIPFFTASAVLPSAPSILAPLPSPTPVPLEPDGTHLVAWQAVGAAEVSVRFDWNLDWDNAVFICHPDPGVTQLSLPHAWVNQFTWGSGELTVEARNPGVSPLASAYVVLRPTRAVRQGVTFALP